MGILALRRALSFSHHAGGGKTALKRRVELASRADAFLCITYNNFPVAGKKLANIDQQYHLANLIRLMLVGVLGAMTSSGIDNLSKGERHTLYNISKVYLNGLDQASLKAAIISVKNLSDKAKETWNTVLGPVSIGINALLAKFGFKQVELSTFDTLQAEYGPLSGQLAFLAGLVPKLGLQSTYVLVDKIDENQLTGKASYSLQFVKPLLNDLSILELKGLGFKFFLWDLIEDEARELARPDRIKTYVLKWTRPQLKEMLSRRLRAHSRQIITNLGQITSLGNSVDVDELIVTLSGGSPRNIIRICKAINGSAERDRRQRKSDIRGIFHSRCRGDR